MSSTPFGEQRDPSGGGYTRERKESTVAGLAQDYSRPEKPKGWIGKLRIPLLVMAPTLIILALGAVVTPVIIVLLNTSNSVTAELSETYFSSVVNDAQLRVNSSMDVARHVIGALADLPATGIAMENQYAMVNEKPTWQLMARMVQNYGIDGIYCYTARYWSGAGPNPPYQFNTTNVTYITASPSFVPPYTDVALGIEDFSFPGGARQWGLYQD
ncbi:hypothetical protein HKX48_002585, partial [Thoreauomyces humboldtii]